MFLKTEIQQVLNSLVGLNIRGPSRAANMLSLQLGPAVEAPTTRAPTREVGAFALHVFCPWRVVVAGSLVVGAGDLFTPADSEADLDTFEWDVVGATWWDVRLAALFAEREEIFIRSVVVDAVGGFALECNALQFEVFPSSSPTSHVETEFWRLFSPGRDEPHFIVDTSGGASRL